MLESDRLDFCCFLESGLRSFGGWSAGSFSEKKVDTRQIFQRHIIQALAVASMYQYLQSWFWTHEFVESQDSFS